MKGGKRLHTLFTLTHFLCSLSPLTTQSVFHITNTQNAFASILSTVIFQLFLPLFLAVSSWTFLKKCILKTITVSIVWRKKRTPLTVLFALNRLPGDIVWWASRDAGFNGITAINAHRVKGLVVTVPKCIEVDVGLGSCSGAWRTWVHKNKRTHRMRKSLL